MSGARLAAFILAALVAALPAAAQRFDHGLLWRVEGRGAPASHVFGTIHVSDPRVTKLPPAVTRAFDEARSLTVEVALGASSVLALAGRMVYGDGRDLRATAGEPLYGRTAAAAEKLGLPEPALRAFKPWAVALLFSTPQQDPSSVLDRVLAEKAAARGIPVHELESLDEQVGVFESLSEADQLVMMRHAVDNRDRMPGVIAKTVEAWLARDLGAMRRIGEALPAAGADAKRLKALLDRRLVDERNARMAERLQGRLMEGGAFIAVGALHLHGEEGVLARLERQGWRIVRVY